MELVKQNNENEATSFKLRNKISEMKNLQEEFEKKKLLARVEDMRVSTKKFLSSSNFGLVYENVLLIISILSCLQYIYQTYLTSQRDFVQLTNFAILERALACLFIFDWCLSFFIADHKLKHISRFVAVFLLSIVVWATNLRCSCSFFSMVDLLTVIPIWVTYQKKCPDIDNITSFGDGILYIMFGLTTTRILRALRIWKKLTTIEDAVDRCLGQIGLSIGVMILFSKLIYRF